MPTLVRASLLASALCCPAVAEPVCQYAGLTGGGDTTLANPCVGYAGPVTCVGTEPGTGQTRLVVVICHPAV